MGRSKGEGRPRGRVYIAGPMRGIPMWNFPRFDRWRDFMQASGWDVTSPADLDRALGMDQTEYPNLPSWFRMEDALHRDFQAILDSQAILLLPGWEASSGVRAELNVAHHIGITVLRAIETVTAPDVPLTYTKISTELVAEHLYPQLVVAAPMESHDERLHRSIAQAAAGLLKQRSFGPIPNDAAKIVGVEDLTRPSDPVEVRVVDPTTGGEKGQKSARFDLIPPDVMFELAKHYGRGCKKYADRNWEKGYSWGLSIGALERHLNLWKQGTDYDEDPEVGTFNHLVAVIWHACALLAFQNRSIGTDDRAVIWTAIEGL